MKILFITPHGGHTGSEILIWQLMQELHRRGKEVAWFSRNRGGLFSQRNEVGFPAEFYQQQTSFLNSIYEGLYAKAAKRTPADAALLRYHAQFKPDLWYLNTATMPDVAAMARRLGIPYVVHFQELTSSFDDHRAEPFLAMLEGATKLIGCSAIVRQRIEQISSRKTELLHSFIDHNRLQVRQSASAIRTKTGLPAEAFVWVMAGTESLRKGYDLIPDLLTHLPDNAWIAWLGKPRDTALRTYVEQRVKHEKLRYVALGEHFDDYYDYLNAADGFVLTSREDPHPVVMIEAAALGKPIAAFNSGGVAEFLLPGMGGVVNSFDPADLARLMQGIMSGTVPTSAPISKARSAEFSMKRQADDFCRILAL